VNKTFLILLFFCISNLIYSQQWIKQDAHFSSDSIAVWNISIVNENVAWAAGYNIFNGSNSVCREFTRTTNGGETWIQGQFLNLPDSAIISYLFALNADTAWIACWNDTTGGKAIFRTNDGGLTWNAQPSAEFSSSGSFPNIVHFFDTENGICMGDPVDGYFEHYTTSDGGQTWSRVPSENLPDPLTGENGYNKGRSFDVAGNVVYYGTSKGRILKSVDFGNSWTVCGPEYLDKAYSVAFKDSAAGIAVDNEVQTYLTFNGGESWYDHMFNTEYWGGQLEYAHGDPGYLMTVWQGVNQGTAYSLNNGTSWTRIDYLFYTDIQFLDTQTGWAGGKCDSLGTGGLFKWDGQGLGINDFQVDNELLIFPNPASFEVKIKTNEPAMINIIDLMGTSLYKDSVEAGITKINISNYQSGLYIILSEQKGKISAVTFLKTDY